MKLEDLAYSVTKKVFFELEHTHHFIVPDHIQQALLKSIVKQLGSLIK